MIRMKFAIIAFISIGASLSVGYASNNPSSTIEISSKNA